MAIRTMCPGCRSVSEVPNEYAGRKVQCQQCQKVYLVDSADGESGQLPQAAGASSSKRRRAVQPSPPRRHKHGGGLALPIAISSAVIVLMAGVALIFYLVLHNFGKEDRPRAAVAPRPNPTTTPDMRGRGGFGGPFFGQDDEEEPGDDKSPPASFEVTDLSKTDASFVDLHPRLPLSQIKIVASPEAAADGSLPPSVLKKVKAGTPRLRVTGQDGSEGEGSGFFVDKGIIVTNRHVVHMLEPGSAKPRSIEVVLDGGEATERSLSGQVIGTDPVEDLAVVRVQGKSLPDPLIIASSEPLQETQRVYTVGYPGGSVRSKNVTVSQTSVSSLIKEQGQLKMVQVHHGMNHGNSGGPVVDVHGQVIGVAVAMYTEQTERGSINNTGINYAIPSDSVHRLLNGSIDRFVLDYPVQDGDKLAVPFTLHLTDPMKRLSKMDIEWWSGASGAERSGGDAPPQPVAGDSDRQNQPVTASQSKVAGTLTLARPPTDKILWFQMSYKTDQGEKRWSSAVPYQPPPPLERKTVHLVAPTATSDKAKVNLSWKDMLTLAVSRYNRSLTLHVNAKFDESLVPDKNERKTKRDYTAFKMGMRVDNSPVSIKSLPKFAVQFAGHLAETPDVTTVDHVPQDARSTARSMSGWTNLLADALDVPLTESKSDSWRAEKKIPLGNITLLPGADYEKTLNVKYTLSGVRQRDGREEAAIRIDGRSTEGSDTLKGLAWVDVGTGELVMVRATFEYHLNANFMSLQARGQGVMELRLQRSRPDGSASE